MRFCKLKMRRVVLEYVKKNSVCWSTEQDCFLIENAGFTLEELSHFLKFTPEEIQARKQVLGLVRREKSFKRLNDVRMHTK